MAEGRVERIFVRGEREGPVTEVARVEAEAGLGLMGDHGHRLAKKAGKNAPDRQVTLIAAEAIEAANAEEGFEIRPEQTRRNVVTRGVDLNGLVGREFTVGEVRLRGIELCEPCTHLQRMTKQPVLQHLVGRGGLRAEILTGGEIGVGHAVVSGTVPRQ